MDGFDFIVFLFKLWIPHLISLGWRRLMEQQHCRKPWYCIINFTSVCTWGSAWRHPTHMWCCIDSTDGNISLPLHELEHRLSESYEGKQHAMLSMCATLSVRYASKEHSFEELVSLALFQETDCQQLPPEQKKDSYNEHSHGKDLWMLFGSTFYPLNKI